MTKPLGELFTLSQVKHSQPLKTLTSSATLDKRLKFSVSRFFICKMQVIICLSHMYVVKIKGVKCMLEQHGT